MRVIIFSMLLGLFCVAPVYATADVQLTIKVIDEDGAVIENAKIEMGYLIRNPDWTSKTVMAVGYTDLKGRYVATAHADNTAWFTITKEGYYYSGGTYKFNEVKNGRWEPWNPELNIVLKKIRHPVPMYARNTMKSRIEIPVVGEEAGFDLVEFDWVAPYGHGNKSDIIFRLERNVVSFKEFESTLTMTFPGRFDGIQAIKENRDYGSQLKLPRLAPASGYQQMLIFKKSWSPGKPFEQTYDKDNNYIFRVRSEEVNGKLVRAMYGKIYGDIQFEPRESKTAEIYFTYFLNPDFTRNLEYGENLFRDLKEKENP